MAVCARPVLPVCTNRTEPYWPPEAQSSAVGQLVFDLREREPAAGGMFRPRHIGAVKITPITRIGVKFFQRPESTTLYAPAQPIFPLLTLPSPVVAAPSELMCSTLRRSP
jgi:hypothetical protein